MTDPVARLDAMRDMLLYANRLYSFCLDAEGNLIFTNCPDREFFYGIYAISSCSTAIREHFKGQTRPLVSYDRMGFAWIAAAQFNGSTLENVHLLGPFFTMETSETYLRQVCRQLKISGELSGVFMEKLNLVPVISLTHALEFGVMLYYAVVGEPIAKSEILSEGEETESEYNEEWNSSSWHGSWEAERELLSAIREGRMPAQDKLSFGRIGRMAMGDPLRQAKNELIVFTALGIRAAIEGGVSPEGAYNLSDYYIQRGEACTSMPEVYNCIGELLQRLIQRVRTCKQNKKYSLPVSACLEFIATHVTERITLDEMARELGYAAYYLSGKVKEETGESVGSIIKRQKIETAKEMLRNPTQGAAEIGEQLAFSSPSFFSATFRKYTGITPSEYQKSFGAD